MPHADHLKVDAHEAARAFHILSMITDAVLRDEGDRPGATVAQLDTTLTAEIVDLIESIREKQSERG